MLVFPMGLLYLKFIKTFKALRGTHLIYNVPGDYYLEYFFPVQLCGS